MPDKVVPIEVKGWCELSTCELGVVAQNCVRFNDVTICNPCLIRLGDGIPRVELDMAEEHIQSLEDQLDEALSE